MMTSFLLILSWPEIIRIRIQILRSQYSLFVYDDSSLPTSRISEDSRDSIRFEAIGSYFCRSILFYNIYGFIEPNMAKVNHANKESYKSMGSNREGQCRILEKSKFI